MNSQQIFDFVGFISTGVSLPFQYWISFTFLKKVLGYKKSRWMFVIFCILLTISMWLVQTWCLPLYGQILIDNVFWLVAICILFGANFAAKLFAFVIQASTVLLTSITFIGFDNIMVPFLTQNLNMAYPGHVFALLLTDLIREGMNLAGLWIELKFVAKQIDFQESPLDRFQSIYLLLPDFASYGLCVIFYLVQEFRIEDTKYSLYSRFPHLYYIIPIISLSLLASMLFTTYTFRRMLESTEIQKNSLLMQQQFKQLLNQQKSSKEFYDGLKSIRHDIKNHLICLQRLAENNNIEEIKNYLVNLDGSIAKLNLQIHTGNPISDAVINEKYNIAKRDGIEFENDFILSEDIHIEPMDLCTILSNSLDNAIEACNRITNPSFIKTISIKSCIRDAYLLIEISNSTAEKLRYHNADILSSKFNPEEHGIGISNIISTVRKYNGVVDVVQSERVFTLNMMLKINL